MFVQDQSCSEMDESGKTRVKIDFMLVGNDDDAMLDDSNGKSSAKRMLDLR